jgi:histidinol-phosphate/aromatic aminotransferase/cobyric acid decarboxylase-like protein
MEMKDLPMFTTQNGVASLTLREIPYQQTAYIKLQATRQPKELLEECVGFCRAVGAEKIYASGHEILENYPHLIIIKSISKSYGVPGLRLGLAASSDTEVISSLRKNMAIWNINSFAEFYLQIYSKYANDYAMACHHFIEERKRFYQELQNINYLRVIPSQANYFLCEVIEKYTATELVEKLLKHNILLKDCSKKAGFEGQDYVRIAIRNSKDNDCLIKALKSC